MTDLTFTPEMRERLKERINREIDAEPAQFEPKPLSPSTDYLPRGHRVASKLGVAVLVATALTTVAAYAALIYVVGGWARKLGAF